ncbi:hypothetical protein VOLCADRAFT_104259 [Volvox carteri f. nagariensis]|uniref:Fe2OG dioxygenase domain-containing protein n=1 Tax=Volvox carteri f. nagariensis TaxID=3068 RepID=D8TSE8_VOLCA|nr:uncharacterized protein VOLCADRAFT_104259 [Volvox carteri f. nagariensis]EFJ49684.1 hypothetical protein VOLCADRAFT_104259 [Volvox carteri f. nagariensis]|eukprot:XP_002949191.1 hypothetical protein VOLCADRAFT_104259 [Volvox carteri f. nagariensis]
MEISVSLNPGNDGVEAVVVLPPGVSSAADVIVEVLGDDTLLVQSPSCAQSVQAVLPVAVDPDTGRVRFKRSTGKLIFTATARRSTLVHPAPPASDTESIAAHPSHPPDAPPPELPPTRIESEPHAAHCSAAEAASPSPRASPAVQAASPSQPDQLVAMTMMGSVTPSPGEAPAPAAALGRATAVTLKGEGRHGGDGDGSSGDGSTGTAASQLATGGSGFGSAATSATSSGATGLPSIGGGVSCVTGCTASAPDNGRVTSPPPAPCTAAVASGADADATTVTSTVSTDVNGGDDDAKLYEEYYCDSPPAMPPPSRHRSEHNGRSAVHDAADSAAQQSICGGGGGGGGSGVNAARVAAAFEPAGGTSSRDAGFSFTAPDLPPPPPLPPGLPPVAPPIDCRYLSVANALRVSAHASTAAIAELMGIHQRGSVAAERRKANKVNEILQRVADTLDAYGYAVLDNYISEAAIKGARAELKVMEPHYSAGMIWVGKEAEAGAQISVSSVRGDVVLWLDDQALNATAFVKDGMLADVDELVFEGLRTRLPYLAGLHRRSDAMMAIYPGKGARFAKHVDNTAMDGRRLTVLTYLNPGWQEQQGGALRLFPVREGAEGVVDVLPLAGRVALFLSAEVAHEVMPAYAPRHAVTLWYFDAGEHAATLTAAKVMPGACSRPAAQAAATALLRDLLADETCSGIPATPEGCAQLGTRVAALDPGAKQLLAAVLGLPSVTALMESMRGLTPESLRRRREELRNMGLGTQHHAPDTSAHV